MRYELSDYEWSVIKVKQCRRVAIRYDKLAANYLAFIKLASSEFGYALSPRG